MTEHNETSDELNEPTVEVCPDCGGEIRSELTGQYCKDCGARVEEPTEKVVEHMKESDAYHTVN